MPLIISGMCVEIRLELSASVTAAGGLLSVPVPKALSGMRSDSSTSTLLWHARCRRVLVFFLVVNCVDAGYYTCGGQYLFNGYMPKMIIKT
jgi:hypothetical protein